MENNEAQAPNANGQPSTEQARATNLSSNLSLVFRVFLPVFGTVFLTVLMLAIWLIDEEELYLAYSIWWPRVLVAGIWLGWILLVWKVLWPLKRIDADDSHLFITDYWTTVRYPWTDVDSLHEQKVLGRRAIRLELKAPGRFGQSILFLPGSHFDEWMEEHGKLQLP